MAYTWSLHKQEAYGPAIVRVPGIARGPGMVCVDHEQLLKVGGTGVCGNGVNKILHARKSKNVNSEALGEAEANTCININNTNQIL